MAVAFVAAAQSVWVSGTTITFAIDVGVGANRGLEVNVCGYDAAGDVVATGVTFAGNAMTLAGTQNENSGNVTQIWTRAIGSDASGSQNVVITFPAAPQSAIVGAVAFTGVDQTTPSNGYVDDFGGPAADLTVDVDVTSAVGDMVVSCCFASGSALTDITYGAGETERYVFQNGAGEMSGATTEPGAASPVTMSVTVVASSTFDEAYLSAVNMKAAASGVTITPGVGSISMVGRLFDVIQAMVNDARIVFKQA